MKHSIALAALVAAGIGLATALPAAAQDQTTPVARKAEREIHRMVVRPEGMGRGRGGILNLVCSDDGAEALEIGFVRLSHRLDLTDAQQPLFDALKTKALTTQTAFADECKSIVPDATAQTAPDLLQGLKSGLAVQQARLTALNEVLPDFEAFYTSLTDAQKADLMPRRAMRLDRDDRQDRGQDRGGPGRLGRPDAPGR